MTSSDERGPPVKQPQTAPSPDFCVSPLSVGPDDRFKCACHPSVSCFNQSCADVDSFLSPYEVLRMKKRRGMKSGEFLEKRPLMPVQEDMKTRVVVLPIE